LQLRPINSAYIRETTYKARNLDEALALFASHDSATYSVAWIDCLARGDSLGRSLLMLGEHDQQGDLHTGSAGRLSVPVDMPGFMLNGVTIAAFNQLYYHRVRQQVSSRRVHYEPFFYPLDGVHHWNRLYGRRGFCQYQFVLPKVAGAAGVKAVLERIAAARRGSFLAVLKAFGESNANPLSFPMEGYTLALDFKLDRGLLPFLDELDRIVLDHGGRLYLAKDARMSAAVFKQSYPRWQEFVAVRQQYGADRCLHSLQSRRLGL
jgi:FAD/FMN-containing dehydrogenase